jgi:hypothetical protein
VIFPRYRYHSFPVIDADVVLGLVMTGNVEAIGPDERRQRTVGDISLNALRTCSSANTQMSAPFSGDLPSCGSAGQLSSRSATGSGYSPQPK